MISPRSVASSFIIVIALWGGILVTDSLGAELMALSNAPQTISNTVSGEERILFSDGRMSLASMKPDGSDKRTIYEGPASFRISPNGRWMLVWSLVQTDRLYEETQDVRLYDLHRVGYRRLTLPEGHWVRLGCWWSDDDRYLRMYSANAFGKPFGYIFLYQMSLNTAKISKIENILTYHLDTGTFAIETYTDHAPVLLDFLADQNPSGRSSCTFPSPDGKYALQWDAPPDVRNYGKPCGEKTGEYKGYYSTYANTYYDIVITSNNGDAKKVVFENNKGDDFGSSIYPITEFPWSPDGKYFVVGKFFGGLFRLMFFQTFFPREDRRFGIYIVDRETLKWNFLAYGTKPYWFAKLPLRFTEQQKSK